MNTPKRCCASLRPMWFLLFVGSLALPAYGQDIDTLFRQFNAYNDAARYADAERIARQMLQVSTTPGWQAASLNSLGRACHSQKRLAEAERYLRQALTIELAGDNVNRGWIPNNLALVYLDQKRFGDAEPQLNYALRVFEWQKGPTSSEVATVLNNLGRLAHDREDYVKAQDYHRRALAIRQQLFGPEHKEVSFSWNNLADINRHLGNYEEAEAQFKKALAMKEKLLGPSHPEVAYTLNTMGMLYRDWEKYEQAEAADRRALEIRQARLDADSPLTAVSLENLALDLEKLGRTSEAEPLRERARRIAARTGTTPERDERTRPLPTWVEVTAQTAQVQDGPNVLATVRKGQQFKVQKVRGIWYAVEVSVGSEKKVGWVENRHLTAISEPASSRPLELVWQTLSPPNAGFRVAFPGSAGATTQTVNGVENRAYTCETVDATFIASYFDVPADKMLTFDAAIGAYTTARQGTLKSEKSFELDLYPGREFTVELPGGNLSRLRLLSAGRRWYQLIAEGSAGVINGDMANRFFNSFQLEE